MSSRSHNKQELSTTNSISSQFTEKYEAASESDEEETSTNAASSSSTLSPNIRLQKNIAGKLSSKFVAKVFMNEKYNSRLDKLYALASSYSGKKDANKLRKTIVKTIFKTSILYKSDLFNENEMKLIDEVRNRFRLLAESIMKLYENNSHTDRSVLIQTLIECQDMSRYHPYSRRHGGKFNNNDGSGVHAPHINFTYANGDIQVVLKKVIQSGVERSLLITPEQFFEISHKSNDILQAGKAMASKCFMNYLEFTLFKPQPSSTVGPFKFILRSNYENDIYEHMYEWEVPNSELRVSIRNRRSDGKRPIDTQFVVEVRIFGSNGLPTDDGIMMAWHNFNGEYTGF
ncbi:hypothetical protein I4U23_006256 [Adineta vaga]|nr:hypothetical protein I4U23_006256 [Adineta vaga]